MDIWTVYDRNRILNITRQLFPSKQAKTAVDLISTSLPPALIFFNQNMQFCAWSSSDIPVSCKYPCLGGWRRIEIGRHHSSSLHTGDSGWRLETTFTLRQDGSLSAAANIAQIVRKDRKCSKRRTFILRPPVTLLSVKTHKFYLFFGSVKELNESQSSSVRSVLTCLELLFFIFWHQILQDDFRSV